MNDFQFANPSYLLLLLLLPIVGLTLKRFDKDARSRLLRFLAEENLYELLKSKGGVREKGKRIAFWLGMVLVILALARPQANPSVEELQSTGLDIYALLDVSKSMDAEDIAPSRIKKAKRTIQHLASRLSGDRLGIIAFANSSVLVSPLTNDYSILDSYLQNIDTTVIPSQGTNLGNALEIAKEAMYRGAKTSGEADTRSNVFLVLSDGEDHGESDLSIVDEIRKSGGILFTIAFGTEKGAPIPIRDERGLLHGYKTARGGQPVLTAVKTGVLQDVAKRGGGHFYFSTLEEGEVEDLLARVGDAQRGSFTKIRTVVYQEFFWIFLLPGLLALFLSFVSLSALVKGPWKEKISWKRKADVASPIGALIFLLIPGELAIASPLSIFWNKERQASQASQELATQKKFGEAADSLKSLQAENPYSPELNYNIGTYLLQDQKGSLGREQLEHLRNADGPLRDRALFNTAGSLALEGKKNEARAAYADLLQRLQQKPSLSEEEKTILAQAKRNVARLVDPNQQPPPQPDKSEQQKNQNPENQNQKNQDQKSPGSQKQESKGNESKDQKDQSNDSKQGDQKEDKQKGEGEKDKNQKEDEKKSQGDEQKKDSEKQKEQDSQKQGEQNKSMPRRGSQPFRERDNMGEDEAKRILGALKERESDLQKKFLKNKVKGGRVNVDDAAKDW